MAGALCRSALIGIGRTARAFAASSACSFSASAARRRLQGDRQCHGGEEACTAAASADDGTTDVLELGLARHAAAAAALGTGQEVARVAANVTGRKATEPTNGCGDAGASQ
eukprot:scaffold1675_cov361-Prasinococcus_capsulatus_cf.AAC.2